eukprot:scaffold101656_cov21-Tisochrysis_lutea.AAC.3
MHAHVWGGDKQRAAPPLPVPLDAARMGVPSKYSILHGSLKGRLSTTHCPDPWDSKLRAAADRSSRRCFHACMHMACRQAFPHMYARTVPYTCTCAQSHTCTHARTWHGGKQCLAYIPLGIHI